MSAFTAVFILFLSYVLNLSLCAAYCFLILKAIQINHLKLILAISILMIISNVSWIISEQILYVKNNGKQEPVFAPTAYTFNLICQGTSAVSYWYLAVKYW